MGTIAQEITRIQGAKSDLKTSIINKGVQVPSNALIDDYASYVDQIQQGGGGGNPFDNCNFSYLIMNIASSNTLFNGRFLDNLDDIYNSVQSGIPWCDFQHFSSGVNTTTEKIQKILKIAEKFMNDDRSNLRCDYMFQYMSTTDSNEVLKFKPTINLTHTINFSYAFQYLGFRNTANNKFKMEIDFDNVSATGYTYTNAFDVQGDRAEIKIFNLPIDKLQGSGTLTFGMSTSGAIKEITVKNGITTTNIRSLNFRYVDMALDKWINLFNSFGSTSVSNVTVTIPSAIYNQLTSAQKEIITDKGYLLASA